MLPVVMMTAKMMTTTATATAVTAVTTTVTRVVIMTVRHRQVCTTAGTGDVSSGNGTLAASDATLVLEGQQFRDFVVGSNGLVDKAAFAAIWPRLRVLARCSPEDKFTIVKGIIVIVIIIACVLMALMTRLVNCLLSGLYSVIHCLRKLVEGYNHYLYWSQACMIDLPASVSVQCVCR